MTRREAEELVAEWGAVLCPEYEITLIDGPCPDIDANGHQAASHVPGRDYLRARIWLHNITNGTLSDEDARETLLHELLHLTLNDLELAAKEPTNALSYDAGRIARETIDRYVERTVDRLATAFAAVTE